MHDARSWRAFSNQSASTPWSQSSFHSGVSKYTVRGIITGYQLYYPAPQLIEGIESPAPRDSALPKRYDRRARQHPAENQRADRKRQRIQRRNFEFKRRAGFGHHGNSQSNHIEKKRPTPRKRKRRKWKHEHEQNSEKLRASEPELKPPSREEIL